MKYETSLNHQRSEKNSKHTSVHIAKYVIKNVVLKCERENQWLKICNLKNLFTVLYGYINVSYCNISTKGVAIQVSTAFFR